MNAKEILTECAVRVIVPVAKYLMKRGWLREDWPFREVQQ